MIRQPPVSTRTDTLFPYPAVCRSDGVGLIFESAAATLRSYAERKRELGVLDFTDQESLLLRALDNPAISATLADELDLLLVDEFQDTSPIQIGRAHV